ncbi:MAG TPA: hypothetical protein VH165_13540 [Kofleriaceae bacterium]|nr:hypothetical protein [Kofleriaceae bacterium]
MSRWRLAAAATLAVWCAVMLLVRRTPAITDDWQGWRQADTQAIARNLAFEDADPLRPRIDWRGDGPGFVETELQLYPTLIAAVMRATGESVWPGQLISLGCVALSAALLFIALARRFGEPAGYAALIAILGHRGMVAMSTSIQPDALALLAFTVGLVAFVSYLEACAWTPLGPSGSADLRVRRRARRRLVVWIAATAIAGLVKPTTLELGIVQFVLVALERRRRALADAWLWIGWAIVLGVVAGYMVYARSLYVTYGNTFGVLSGGDSKLPACAMLGDRDTWLGLARYSLHWGVGFPAIPAALYLLWRRQLGAAPIALAIGAVALCLVAMRYTSGPFGTHYHLPHVVLGGWLVAAAAADVVPFVRTRFARRADRIVRGLLAALAVAALIATWRGLHFVRALPAEPETAIGERLATRAAPGTLVAVRVRAEAYNTEWQTANNYEDPRVFYLSRTHGWAVPNDLTGPAGPARLTELAAHGAKFYVHVRQYPIDDALAAWLAGHATRVDQLPEGEIYQLATEASSAAPRTK